MRISDWSSDVCSSDLGQKGFLADHVEIAGIELRTGRARPQAAPGLGELQPAFHSLVIEGGADLAILFQLRMLIVGIAEAQLDLVDQAAVRIHLGARVDAVLRQAQPRRLLLLPRPGRKADRHPIEAVIMAVCDAQAAALSDIVYPPPRGPLPPDRTCA